MTECSVYYMYAMSQTRRHYTHVHIFAIIFTNF